MLEIAEINEIIGKAASAIFKGETGVQRVISEPTADPWGQEALRVIIILKRGSADKIGEVDPLEALVRINAALQEANEERFPIVEYATEEEWESSDDTES